VLRTDDLDYQLPEGRIATHAAEPRDSARMLVIGRATGEVIEHAFVRDLPRFLRAGDCIVVNSSAVVRARLEGHREDTLGRAEGLYLGPADADGTPRAWACLLQGRRMKPGVRVVLHDRENRPSPLALRLLRRIEDTPGVWVVGVEGSLAGAIGHGAGGLAALPDVALLDAIGRTPLPPYIRRARERDHEPEDARSDDADHDRYQTVYARGGVVAAGATGAGYAATPTTPTTPTTGSVAAPTAGLHLTPELLARLARHGVAREEVVLHVGLGTFKPVESAFVEQHPMHREWCHMPDATRDRVARTRSSGGRVIAVGTTAARTIETFGALGPGDARRWIDTNLLITPGYAWRATDALLTNFHLPRSTLLAMVAALLDVGSPGEGLARLKRAYAEAIERGYRFYSFGDAMLVIDEVGR
jgi:S-adenosylmethionine:tRNA ribosyltransferase-isomerase